MIRDKWGYVPTAACAHLLSHLFKCTRFSLTSAHLFCNGQLVSFFFTPLRSLLPRHLHDKCVMQFTRYKTHDAASSPHLGVWNRKAELCQMGAPKEGSPVQVYVCVHARAHKHRHSLPASFPRMHRACAVPGLLSLHTRARDTNPPGGSRPF